MTDYIATVDKTLIEALYMAGNDARHWQVFLKHALKMFNVQLAVVHIFSPETDDPLTYIETERREAVPDNVLRSHLAALAARTRQGISLQDSHSLTLVVQGRRQFGMTLVRDAARPPFTVQGRNGLDSLAPFVTQVMNAPAVRSTAAIDRQYLQALNAWPRMPVAGPGRRSCLLPIAPAEALLVRGTGLRQGSSGVCFDDATSQGMLKRPCATTRRSRSSSGKPAARRYWLYWRRYRLRIITSPQPCIWSKPVSGLCRVRNRPGCVPFTA